MKKLIVAILTLSLLITDATNSMTITIIPLGNHV